MSMKSQRATLFLAVAMLLLSTGCIKKMILNGQIKGIQKAGIATKQETDPAIVKRAMPYALKQYEGLMVVSDAVGANTALIYRMAAEGFVSYGYGFVAPEMWGREFDGSEEVHFLKRRVKDYLTRAHKYARLYLESENAKATDEDEIDALYWVAYTWAQRIGADTDDMEWLSNLGTVDMIMQHIEATAPNHEAGGALMTLAVAACKKGAGFSGKEGIAEAKTRLERAMELTPGYLMPQYLYGRWYCQATGNAKCYVDNLKAVLHADPNGYMPKRLTNMLAKDWARYWLIHGGQFFEDYPEIDLEEEEEDGADD
jgi:hypothetical protein